MGPEVCVVEKLETKSLLELGESERGSRVTIAEGLLECLPEAFDDGDGAALAYGSETMSDAESMQVALQSESGELGSVVGDEVRRTSEALDGGAKKGGHLSGGGLEIEDLPRQRHSREDVEDEGDVEVEEPEAA
jgi:hypothetical protein